MNRVVLMGRLVRDPEVRVNPQDTSKVTAKFTLAVDRRVRRDAQQTADFISCVAFDSTANFSEKYIHKGTKIVVSGKIRTDSYTNQNGVKVYTTDVVCDDVEFAESKSSETTQQEPTSGGYVEVPSVDEELPFR